VVSLLLIVGSLSSPRLSTVGIVAYKDYKCMNKGSLFCYSFQIIAAYPGGALRTFINTPRGLRRTLITNPTNKTEFHECENYPKRFAVGAAKGLGLLPTDGVLRASGGLRLGHELRACSRRSPGAGPVPEGTFRVQPGISNPWGLCEDSNMHGPRAIAFTPFARHGLPNPGLTEPVSIRSE